MTALRRTLFLSGLAAGLLCPAVHAQDDVAAPPVTAVSPVAPAAVAVPAETPAPAAGDLFPPVSALPRTSAAQTATGNHHGGNHLSGNRAKRGARAGDILAQQADADPLEVRVAYRRDKTLVMTRDPGLADLLHNADLAPSDKEKREWLRQYYTQLFARIKKVDPSAPMAAHLALLTQVVEQRYDPKRRNVAGEEDLVNGRGSGRGRHR